MLREKCNADIPDEMLVSYLQTQVMDDEEYEYYQSEKNPSKKKIGKIEYFRIAE